MLRSLNSIILSVSSSFILNIDDNRPEIFDTCFLSSFAYCSEGSFILVFLGRSFVAKNSGYFISFD